MLKNLSLIIKANQDFIRHTGDDAKNNAPLLSDLYDSISYNYIPLLRMIDNLSRDNIPCRFSLVLPPVLCNLLSDEVIQDSYVEWLDKKIELGTRELRRLQDDEVKSDLCKQILDEYILLKDEFLNRYERNLIARFGEYMSKGYIELLGTTGTDVYIPHFADLKEIISAQIECGLHAYKQYFGIVPDGFWLPGFGYTPGIEKLIKGFGYTYTILDARSVLLVENMPKDGIFYPTRTENSLVIFANDPRVNDEIFGKDGFYRNSVYRNENRDIGFDLPLSELEGFFGEHDYRFATGFKYWNKTITHTEDSIYNVEDAKKQTLEDAKVFVNNRVSVLNKASVLLSDKDFVTTVCAFDEADGKKWVEQITFLENVFRLASEEELNMASPNQMLSHQFEIEKITPYYSSRLGAGYGECLLSSKNCWMIRYIRKACERMIDLADRFPNDTGLKTRLLNLGAKELLIAQSMNLPRNIDEANMPEFAIERFKESIVAFTEVFDSLGSNTVSTEWLTSLEAKDSVFNWMNYRIFSKKK